MGKQPQLRHMDKATGKKDEAKITAVSVNCCFQKTGGSSVKKKKKI